jgi:very-short-patch-repair endonuclease
MRETKLQRSRCQAHERRCFVEILKACGEDVIPEFKFNVKRRWRFDYVILGRMVAIEIEGLNGRHQRTGGFLKDMEKYNEACVAGYRVFRFTTRQIADASALATLARAGIGVRK